MKKGIGVILFCALFPVFLYASGWQTLGDGQSPDAFSDFSGITTDNMTEGITNKYFTDTRTRNTLSASGNMNYDNATGSFSLSSTPVFSGVTIGSLNGVLKASGGVVSGNATKADIGLDNVTDNAQVTSVSASSPLAVSGGSTTPIISINASPSFTDVTANGASLVTAANNIATLGFLRAVDNSKVLFSMQDGIVDRFQDSSGISAATDAYNNSTSHYYAPYSLQGANAKYVVHCNGSGATFVDSSTSAHGLTVGGNATQSATQSKFGGNSCYFAGSGDYIVATGTLSDFKFTGDFTVDTWVYVPANCNCTMLGTVAGANWNTATNNEWVLLIDGTNKATFATKGGAAVVNDTAISANTWTHIAVVRASGTIKVYVNGVGGSGLSYATTTPATDPGGMHTSVAEIGLTGQLVGYLDEIRIVNGTAAWTSNFEPPTAPYNATSAMVLASTATTAVAVPTTARVVLFESDVDALTVNTDLVASVSRDGGTTYSAVSLINEGTYDVGRNILAGPVDISGQPSGTAMKWKVQNANGKKFTLYGVSLSWN